MPPVRQIRWTALLAFIGLVLVIVHRSEIRILPSPLIIPHAQNICPHTSSPPHASTAKKGFNWKDVKTHYPVQQFAQIPARSGSSKEAPRIQYNFQNDEPALEGEIIRKRRQAAVKTAFKRAWKSYKERAWMKDELRPISGGSRETFGGWGATLVDSLDTLWIMDMKDEFEEAVNAVTQIDFKPNDSGEINMFETTIRYLGGLLSAYDITDCKDSRLLAKAVELGDMIYASFDTPNRMPVTRWSAKKAANGEEQPAAAHGIIAELASFSLEFTRLSQLTGDMRYYDAVTRVTSLLSSQQNNSLLPGLWPVGINVASQDLTTDSQFSLGAMADSAYEYLGKTYQLLRGTGAETQYEELYNYAMDTVIRNLLFRPMVPDQADILIPTNVRVNSDASVTQDHTAQHLSCFAGGMFALGGRLFKNDTYIDVGKRITDGCVWTYQNAPNGVMPELFSMATCPSFAPCAFDPATSQRHPGFASVFDARYILRPEAIESVFYMYRITGDGKYQDVAWSMFQAVDSRTRTRFANAAMRDVMITGEDGGGLEDSMESFWLAETLKYFYLVFCDEGVLGLDEWVFNTEAHAFRVG
ncbi:glycoside hydrolase [Dendryphion nanum]|uniref:alpha-1,2-Mannosidase n=1 Tax=Dendryphion nanum TaxID=256645 RepID=A0A9P9IXL7_9PLEO|nr:glycoside hydrolase [Dendryphion nanum]